MDVTSDLFNWASMGLSVLWALLYVAALVVVLVFRRVSAWTTLLAVAFGLKLLVLLANRVLPLVLIPSRGGPPFENLRAAFFGLSLLGLVGDILLVVGVGAVLASCAS